MTTVGVVGLGLLGSAIAGRLMAAGHAVVGHDVVAARGAALAGLGSTSAPSLEAVVASADVVCTVLPTPAAVEEVLLGPRGVAAVGRAGLTVMQMSTISPALTERLASSVSARGLAFLDCPVSGTSGMVAAGHGLFLVGGDAAAIARWRPLLESVLPRVVAVGRAGQATLLKLVANLLVGVHSAAAAEALELARRGGLDLDLTLEVLAASAAGSRMLEVRGPLVVRGEFPPQMKLDLFLKDLRLIREAADAAGASVPLTEAATRLYAAARDAGHGGEDLAVVARVIADGAGPAGR
jgi:3-hydroxyisobutyrate dehydrogenase-like beta-hydroxyacid dehydrogenase